MARVRISWRNGFMPALIIIALVMRFYYRVEGWWWYALLLVPLAFYIFVIPALIQKKLFSLDRQIQRMLAQGREKDILPLCRRQFLLYFTAPGPAFNARLGLAHAAVGEHQKAARCYRNALEDGSLTRLEKMPLELGLANALYHLSDDAGAEKIYMHYYAEGTLLPEGAHNLAHIMMRNGKSMEKSLALLDRAAAGPLTPFLERQIGLTRMEAAIVSDNAAGAEEIRKTINVPDLDPESAARFDKLSKKLKGLNTSDTND